MGAFQTTHPFPRGGHAQRQAIGQIRDGHTPVFLQESKHFVVQGIHGSKFYCPSNQWRLFSTRSAAIGHPY